MTELVAELAKARQLARDNPSLKGWRVCDTYFLPWLSEHMGPENIAYLRLIIRNADAIAAGTQSAETGETPAQSEGCQSGAKAHRPNTNPSGHLLHKRSD